MLLIALLLQDSVCKFGIVVDFFISREKIAQTECIQKDQKDSCCKGSCVLTDKIKEVDQEQNKMPLTTILKTEPFSFLIPFHQILRISDPINLKSVFRYLYDLKDVTIEAPSKPPCM
jgi:hypothetical protein